METIQENNEVLKVVIDQTNSHAADSQDTPDAAAPAPPPRVQQRRKSSLKLRKGSLEEDESPISVVYNPRVDVVELSNIADGTATIDSTSEPPITDLNLLLAATYVEDAINGRHSDFKVSERHLRLYRMYQNKWGQVALFFFILMHFLLTLFEKPAVPGLEMSYWVTMLMETGILLFYAFRLTHISIFTPLTRFWSDTKNILIVILIAILKTFASPVCRQLS